MLRSNQFRSRSFIGLKKLGLSLYGLLGHVTGAAIVRLIKDEAHRDLSLVESYMLYFTQNPISTQDQDI
jgi:hypothetical protein